MKIDKTSKEKLSGIMIGGALLSVVLSGFGYIGLDIWLASTQWLLVSAVMALFAIYLRLA